MLLDKMVHVATTRPPHTVADVFRQYGEVYRAKYPLSPEQARVMREMMRCRTAALGGHVNQCDSCGKLSIAYNPCGNRHCNQCGAWARAKWLEQQKAMLLPSPYFQVVFTTDHAINPLGRANPKAIYDLLFASAWQSLKELAAKYLGGEVGVTAVLHTWGQKLDEHLHLHCIVTGGALSFDQQRWQACRADFLVPVVELSQRYRELLCQGLQQLGRRGQLAEATLATVVAEIEGKNWQVYAQPPCGGPEQVYGYLGRYVNRIALANERIIKIEAGQVSFCYQDNQDEGREKVLTLPAVEFIRRFLSHVLPDHFVRIRYYGLHQPSQRRRKLARCRTLLGVSAPPAEPLTLEQWWLELTGEVIGVCPLCGQGRLFRRGQFEPPSWWLLLLLSLLGLATQGRVVSASP